MQILIDTSVIIDFLRQNNKKNTSLYKLVSEENQLFISIFTHTELFSGKSVWRNKKALEELDKVLSGIKILPYSIEISQFAGEVRAKYAIDLIDAIIASTAILSKLPLSTLNNKHFQKIPNLKLI